LKTSRHKFTPQKKITVVFDSLRAAAFSRYLQKVGLGENTVKYWKMKVFEGAKIYLENNFKFSKIRAIQVFRKKLIKQEKTKNRSWHVKNLELRRAIRLCKPERKKQIFTMAERSLIVKRVCQSELSIVKACKCFKIAPENIRAWQTKKVKQQRIKLSQLLVNRLAVFKVLHAPPQMYGINRTSWRQQDVINTLRSNGHFISRRVFREIIESSGYKYRKAKVVLTSHDLEYDIKIARLKRVLRNLKKDEKFFSIDEFGPFSIKHYGGRTWTAPARVFNFLRFQKSKGSLILTAALELSTNQITHFYSSEKNSKEIIKLIDRLRLKYRNDQKLFLSWDAASWHSSKEVTRKILAINRDGQKPFVKIIPLPASAQFLNVIESVFSGMAKAILHNSNYKSKSECRIMINKYIKKRNSHFKLNPKRAGNKIWGRERVAARFEEGNNCKDPLFEFPKRKKILLSQHKNKVLP
jgi:transposase-like protein